MKPLFWVGSSKKDLLQMPTEVVDVFGYALYLAQSGTKHQQAKPVEDQEGSTYRAVYTVRFSNGVYVLHCFQKKSRKGIETPKADRDMIEARLKLAQKHSEGA